jgi:hypothetical protein
MLKEDILELLRRNLLAVESTRSWAGAPQSAVVGIVASDELELFFDTLEASRKAQNLRRDGRISLVVGWDLADARTLQLEGVADEPSGGDLARLKELYLARFPDGVARQAWPGICYFRVRPTWIRISDFSGAEPSIVEHTPVGTTYNTGQSLLESRLSGRVTVADVLAWQGGLEREVAGLPAGARFKFLSDSSGFDPVDIAAHKAMREVVPRLLAAHGMRPAVIDLFDPVPALPVKSDPAVKCVAFANVHHDEVKMRDYAARIGQPEQRFFSARGEAQAWLDSLSV